MENTSLFKKPIEKMIIENKLFNPLIESCNDGLILSKGLDCRILGINQKTQELFEWESLGEIVEVRDILDENILGSLFDGKRVETEINDTPVKISCVAFGDFTWFFITNCSDTMESENLSRKALELNKELIHVFNQYGDETLMVTDGNGIIEFAGEKISQTCGVDFNFFIGKSVFEMEKEGMFKPSISVKVLATKKPQVVIQKTRTGIELVSVGAPVLNNKGNIEKVISVTRDYTTQIKISKIIAELGNETISEDMPETVGSNEMITCNDTMFEIKTLVKMIAPTKATVLLSGETGTGKEVIAKYIYGLSDRKEKPFIKVNCGTIAPSLVESELFGYEEGSFTGANKGGKMGLIEAANGGTLFLDEIGELPLEQQVKLLHVLQEKMLIRVGGTTSIDLDVRIIAATNKDLQEQVVAGTFREDLYYRLNVIPIHLPALRQRIEDVPLLAQYFFKRFCRQYNKEKQLSNNAILILEQYNWPGNIRQLENTIERVILTTSKPTITAKDLPEFLLSKEEKDEAVKVEKVIKMEDAVSLLEKKLIKMALDEHGTTVKAAEALGINQSTVSRKIAQYDLKKRDE